MGGVVSVINTEKQSKANILMTQGRLYVSGNLLLLKPLEIVYHFSGKQDGMKLWNGVCVLHALNPPPVSGKRTAKRELAFSNVVVASSIVSIKEKKKTVGECYSSAFIEWMWVS